MEDHYTLKDRYEAATDVYLKIAEQNVQRALRGAHPSIEALERETDAHEQLASARRAYMESLRSRT